MLVLLSVSLLIVVSNVIAEQVLVSIAEPVFVSKVPSGVNSVVAGERVIALEYLVHNCLDQAVTFKLPSVIQVGTAKPDIDIDSVLWYVGGIAEGNEFGIYDAYDVLEAQSYTMSSERMFPHYEEKIPPHSEILIQVVVDTNSAAYEGRTIQLVMTEKEHFSLNPSVIVGGLPLQGNAIKILPRKEPHEDDGRSTATVGKKSYLGIMFEPVSPWIKFLYAREDIEFLRVDLEPIYQKATSGEIKSAHSVGMHIFGDWEEVLINFKPQAGEVAVWIRFWFIPKRAGNLPIRISWGAQDPGYTYSNVLHWVIAVEGNAKLAPKASCRVKAITWAKIKH